MHIQIQMYTSHTITIEDLLKCTDATIKSEFIELEKLASKQTQHPQMYECNHNQNLMNRYCNVLPYEHNRVKANMGLQNDYINASYMKLLSKDHPKLIACQAPVFPFYNFWKAIFENKISLLIMLCNFEDPKRGKQADPYWQDEIAYVEDDIKVTVLNSINKDKFQNYEERTMKITVGSQTHTLRHIHWFGWHDFGIPSPACFNIVKSITNSINTNIDNNEGVVVHCSAGIGRTGTLLAIVDALRLIKEKKQKVSIFWIVKNLRENRFGSVQTYEQYHFIYDFLRKCLHK